MKKLRKILLTSHSFVFSHRGFRILLIVITLLILGFVIIITTDTTYIIKALIYNTADIDDNDIFIQRKVYTENGEEWLTAKDYNKIRLPLGLSDELEDLETIAFLIIKDDSIKFEKYWDNYSSSSLSNSFSMAKSIVSILTGIAIDEGLLTLDKTVGNFIPEYNFQDRSEITVEHLLTMSSGLDWWEIYYSPVSHTTEAYYGNDLLKLVNKLKIINTPGAVFKYKSGDTQLLGIILQKATNMTLSEYASTKLWKHIGAKYNAEWSIDNEEGYEKAYCCFFSNARDFARIGKLYLNKGNWNGKQIVSKKYVEQSLKPINIKNYEDEPVDYYGYSWWLINHHGNNFYARGILGQYIIVIPAENLIIVRLGYKRRLKHVNHHPVEIYSIIDGVIEMYGKK